MDFNSDILRRIKTSNVIKLAGISSDSQRLKDSMISFLERDVNYRSQFSQQNFDIGFDGYSFPGQEDSINQAYDDHLHSMVISEFYPISKYPKEFEKYIETVFPKLIDEVKNTLDLKKVSLELGLEDNLGFSFSVNYYPSYKDSGSPNGLRLTEHIDGSLLTIFPYGFGEGLQIKGNENWEHLPSSQSAICFPGFMMDLATNGMIPALNHRLCWEENLNTGRFAFALFIVPKPNVILDLGVKGKMKTEEYYDNYLSLFN